MKFFGIGGTDEFRDPSLAQDLTKLQINTIIKSNISGNVVPAIRFALCDISSRYGIKLCQLGVPRRKLDAYIGWGGFKAFDQYQQLAKEKQLEMQDIDQGEAPNYYVLQRIRSNSNRLKAILDFAIDKNEYNKVALYEAMKNGLEDLKLPREDFMVVQKYWELGTEQIMMQTVIQLDGDVCTRVLSNYAGDEHRNLHIIHNNAVNLSYQYWRSIIQIIADFMTTVFVHLLPDKNGRHNKS